LRRQSEYDADKGKGYDPIYQGRKKRMVSKQRIWSQPAHNNQQQEKKDNRINLRRDEERKKARQQDNKTTRK
jgi:hypothetical protein